MKKSECLRQSDKEWVPGHIRVIESSNASEERIKTALEISEENWKQTGPARELDESTKENVEWSKISGYCRTPRDRSSTQPSSYETDGSDDPDISGDDISFDTDSGVPDWAEEI